MHGTGLQHDMAPNEKNFEVRHMLINNTCYLLLAEGRSLAYVR